MERSLGIYVHIPFCIQKCIYCDFCSFPSTDASVRSQYVSRLVRDIEAHASVAQGYCVDTVYFGGGTPSCLDIDHIKKIMEAIRNTFEVSLDAEITLECNPATANREYFKELFALGVNRISLGLQSGVDKELALLGRAHNSRDFAIALADARAAGFDNVSADLMYGIPDQTMSSLEQSLDFLAELSPEHISVYGLMVEPNTYLAKNVDQFSLADDDTQYKMYLFISDYLKKRGYDKYEISNFSKGGNPSRHNTRYWHSEEYLGFGVAAHSYFGGERYGNSTDIDAYISDEDVVCERHKMTDCDALSEYIMLRMRLSDGIGEDEYRARFGRDLNEDFASLLTPEYREFLTLADGRLSFTDKGFFVSNTIISRMLEAVE